MKQDDKAFHMLNDKQNCILHALIGVLVNAEYRALDLCGFLSPPATQSLITVSLAGLHAVSIHAYVMRHSHCSSCMYGTYW